MPRHGPELAAEAARIYVEEALTDYGAAKRRAAERLGLSIDQVEVAYGDSIIPGAILTGIAEPAAGSAAALKAAGQSVTAPAAHN